MVRISRLSQAVENVRFGALGIAALLFADHVVLFASSDRDLQHSLGRFAAECEAAGMRFRTSQSEAMVLCRKPVVQYAAEKQIITPCRGIEPRSSA